MSKEIAIKITNLSKEFKLPHEKHGSLKSVVVNRFRGFRAIERQKVLNDISLDIHKGEFFGIIGRNGNGKSTLLKLLAGVYSPLKGAIQVNGKLTPFIELGVGFNPELTGRDNVFLNGALLGFSQLEMQEMYDDIVEFAELEKFMDQKLKNYSSGMQVRLAFSIAIRARSDILLIDEVLAVGDTNFQNKCIEVFKQLKREGRTIVFVSHSMGHVRDFCDRVAVINKGKLEYLGDTEKAIDIYNKINAMDEDVRTRKENKNAEIERFGTGAAFIETYKILNKEGKEAVKLESNAAFSVELGVKFLKDAKNPVIGAMFRKNPQENLLGINNYYQNKNFGSQKAGDYVKVVASGVMPLAPGPYYVSFSVSDAVSASDYVDLDNLNNVIKINVEGSPSWGLLATEIPMEIIK